MLNTLKPGLDPKVVAAFTETTTAQMTGYLAITGLNLAILINFKNAQLEGKRIVHQDTQNTQTRVSHGFDGWSKILIRSIRVIRG